MQIYLKVCLVLLSPVSRLRCPRERGSSPCRGMAALKARVTGSFGPAKSTLQLIPARRTSEQRYFDRFPTPKRGTLDSGFHKGQSFNTVFDSRESTNDLVWRFVPHPCNDGSRKVGVKVSKCFKIPFGMADLHTRHLSGLIDDQRIFATRHNLLKPLPFTMNQAIGFFLMPFEATRLAENTKTQ